MKKFLVIMGCSGLICACSDNPPAPVINIGQEAPQHRVKQAGWQWPATGKIIQSYSSGWQGNAGINIAGQLGSPVRAALSGKVVYCGHGIRGYGNLIIIKHNNHYLSAYAYNQRLLVTLGQHVRTGEIIATMGRDNWNLVMLHFEIRYNGQAVDPLYYLR